jgi:glycosyltransferase involved in cell wall biosynthesis
MHHNDNELSGKRVIAVVYSNYPADPRPRRAAEALVQAGASVEIICLKEFNSDLERERHHGVDITRLPLIKTRGGKLAYLFQYGRFILFTAAILAYRSLKRRYDLVHVHNMPDVLVYSALVPKLLGAKVILDLHDPMPELMMTIFGLRKDSRPVRILKILEKWSIAAANLVLTPNEAFKRVFGTRSCRPEKVQVIMNSPDEEIFKHQPPVMRNDGSKPFVIMYHGSLVERHGIDLAIQALEKITIRIPEAELRIYGFVTPFLEQILDATRPRAIWKQVHYCGQKNLTEIAEAIRHCDVGIIPNRLSAFIALNMPTRIFEYLSQGKPVIAPRSEGITDYFGPESLLLFESGDADELARQMEFAFWHPEQMHRMAERGQAVYCAHRWSVERLRFLELAGSLITT